MTHANDDPDETEIWYARAIIADAPDYDAAQIRAACDLILKRSTDSNERTQAQALRDLVEGEVA